jgi:catechol 2,3-dioxygenase-like lactoylglutathione lyase family enzyme
VPKASGILGVDHVAVVTSSIREAEAQYGDLFATNVIFRVARYRGDWVTIDAQATWDEIARGRVRIEGSMLRAGGLTISVLDESGQGKAGSINHVGIGCADVEWRRIKEVARKLGLRFLEDSLEAFKFLDGFGVIWEVSRGMDVKASGKRLDLRTGEVT